MSAYRGAPPAVTDESVPPFDRRKAMRELALWLVFLFGTGCYVTLRAVMKMGFELDGPNLGGLAIMMSGCLVQLAFIPALPPVQAYMRHRKACQIARALEALDHGGTPRF